MAYEFCYPIPYKWGCGKRCFFYEGLRQEKDSSFTHLIKVTFQEEIAELYKKLGLTLASKKVTFMNVSPMPSQTIRECKMDTP